MKRSQQLGKKILSFTITLLLLLSSLTGQVLATNSEKIVKVGYFAFEGYHMIDENGTRSGYGYDLLQQMASYTNWQYEYVGYDKSWSEMQEMLANGEIDLLTSAQKTTERLERFDFSDRSIGTSSAILTVKSGNDTYLLQDYANWSGMRIGLLKGNSRNNDLANFAKEKGFTYIPVYYESTSELVSALQDGKDIDAAVTSNLRAVENESILAKFAPSPFYIMVKKGNTELLNEINKALELLYNDDANLATELMNKYYTPKSGDEIAFTAEERQYINKMKDTTIVAFMNPDRIPISYFKNNQATGIIGDLAAEIIKRTGLNIEIKELTSRDEYIALLGSEEADVCLDFIHNYSMAEKYGYHITSSYIDSGISKLYLKSNSQRQTAGLVNGSYIVTGFEESIKGRYELVKYYDTTEALVKAIEKKEVDVGYFYTRVAERLVLDDDRNRLASEIVYDSDVSFCVAVKSGTDPLLFSIIDKAVISLGQETINSIVREYTAYGSENNSLVAFIYDNPLVFASFIGILFILFILIILIIFITKQRKTEAKRLEEEKKQNALLSEALSAAKVAGESKSNFLSRMSHEMRTPLNAVIGFMELAKDATPAQSKAYQENASIAAKQLLSIINDVLDMSAINAGKLKISNATFDIKQLLNNLKNVYSAQCTAKKLKFRLILETPVDDWLVGDALRLNQILTNLLGNAVKFTKKGFVQLRISQRGTDNGKIFLCFTVEDSGCGMSADMLSRIGEPFEQENANTAVKYGGSGLGLSIVKMLTSLMGGAFKAESKEGVGSTFIVDLPFMKSEMKLDKQISHIKEKLKILVVDDVASDREYLSMVLSHLEVDYHCTSSGKEALTALEKADKAKDNYNLCFIDWKMPDMDGIDLTKKIREKYGKDIIIIVISAYDDQRETELAEQNEVNLFMPKPLLQNDLCTLLTNLTGGTVKKNKTAKRPEFSGKRILLAEDNSMNQMVAVALIKKLGITCETANDGKEAVDKFLASPADYYDAILMDIQMPNMNGYEATKAIRNSDHPDAKKIGIIALSANAFNEDVAKSISMGMDDHVAKPIEINSLISALENAFAKKDKLD